MKRTIGAGGGSHHWFDFPLPSFTSDSATGAAVSGVRLAGRLIWAAVICGLASSAYGYGPGYGYMRLPRYGYYDDGGFCFFYPR